MLILLAEDRGGGAGNTADLGGGISISPAPGLAGPILVSNTIVGNHSTRDEGSGIYGSFSTGTQIFNNLIVDGFGKNPFYCRPGDPSLGNQGSATFGNNDVFSGGSRNFAGRCRFANFGGNIYADPLLVDQASDFHLRPRSPAIDT